jgi:hypothetical protein
MPASQPANTTQLTQTIHDTQANSVLAQKIDLGSSGKAQGLLIKGTGSFPASTTELDKHLTLWGSNAAGANKLFSVGFGTPTYTESWYMLGRGDLVGTNTSISQGGSPNAGGSQAFNSVSATGAGQVRGFVQTGENLNNNTVANDFSNTQVAVTINKTDHYGRWDLSRSVTTAALVTDTYALASFKRTNQSNHAGATLNAGGQVILAQNVRTQTLGTVTDTVDVIKAVQDASSTGDIIAAYSGATKHFSVKSNGLPAWVAADTQSTVGAAGAASALPVLPTGYLKIDVSGTTKVVPYYDAA